MTTESDDLDERVDDDTPPVAEPELSDFGFRRLLEKLHTEHNFDFRQYKEASLMRRIRRRLSQVRVESLDAYAQYLDRVRDEYVHLLDAILINVTRFFRDPEAWKVLREQVVPHLIEDGGGPRSLRVWSAGCSSGEEPYSVAMVIADALGSRLRDFDVKIYATDIDEDALTTARAGLYRLEALRDVPAGLLERYFQREGQMYRVRRDLRKMTIFGRHDLTQDPPLSHIDLLVCRNILIYFDSDLQERILPRFHYAIRDHGYLFLGKSESMLARSRRFTPVDFKWRIFERLTIPVADIGGRTLPFGEDPTLARDVARQARAETQHLTLRFQGIIDALQSAVMVIDPADTIVTWNPAAERLFDVPAQGAVGKKFRDLDISYRLEGLRSRIEEVKTTHTRARMEDLSFARRGGDVVHVAINIAPLYADRRRIAGVLVVTDNVTEYVNLQEEVNRIGEQSATANEELQSTNEELETTNEELQSTNEELETTNEELQSTNEELETTVEELRSINAELGALNIELERRTQELNDLDRYHQGLLDASDQAIFVLDRDFTVKTWNRVAARMWGLRASDAVGREFFALPIGEVTRQAAAALRKLTETRRGDAVTGVSYTQRGGVEGVTTLRLFPLIAEEGELRGIMAMATPNSAGDTS
jgi:two-component system, chemotaxis family, CheB/CheR fusion protein